MSPLYSNRLELLAETQEVDDDSASPSAVHDDITPVQQKQSDALKTIQISIRRVVNPQREVSFGILQSQDDSQRLLFFFFFFWDTVKKTSL